MSRILFVIKKRGVYGVSFGLLNSAESNAECLQKMGHDAKVVQVIDNNSIDREVFLYKPTHVVIEAIWVVPSKMEILANLHKKVKWYVCVHSKTPFIANEGIAFPWLVELTKLSEKCPNLFIACNNKDFNKDIQRVLNKETFCLPNMYRKDIKQHSGKMFSDTIKIGCFGAMRPMKNHLEQAMAAIIFVQSLGKKLEFHVNGVTEQKGENVLKNLRAVMEISENKLIEHPWMPHDKFLDVIREMDIGLQVSLSESFNIVTADFVNCGIPIVVSDDVDWMPWYSKCCPTYTEGIVKALSLAYAWPILSYFNKTSLEKHNKYAERMWSEFLNPS